MLVIKIQGVKIVNKTNLIKKLAALGLVITGALTLAACGSSSSIPFGNISNNVYLEGDGYRITEKELYEEMRLSSSSILIEMIEREIFKGELALIEASPETYKADILKYANEAIFGTSDKDSLEKIEDSVLTQRVLSFMDSFYLTNDTITENDIDTVNFENHDPKILNYYKLTVAKRIYAKGLLAEEVKDKNSTSFINVDTALQPYFNSNIKDNYDMSAITIRFVNQNEANATLRYFNIKAYRSQWYVIQDPRTTVVDGYAATVLADLSINNTGSISDADYAKYYDKYAIDPSRTPASLRDVPLTLDETLVKFLEIYNYIYSYREQVGTAYTVDSLLADLDNLPFTKSFADYGTNTTLRTYLYNTLGTGENDTRFTSSPRLNGSNYYLVFKLEAHNEEILEWMDSDKKLIIYTETGELTAKALEVFAKVEESKLTASYISSKANERLSEADITVYDELVQLYLKQSISSVKFANSSNKNLIAKVGSTEITVDSFYQELEKKLGVSVAIDMAIRETLKASDYASTITAEKRAEFRSNIETIIQQFGQNYYAQSGYPATMGRKNFLMLAFRATNIDEAVQNVYVASALEEAYLKDLDAHYDNIYQTLADYANRLREQFFSLSTSHLLIFIDMDENDAPDDPKDYLESLTPVKRAEFEALVLELMQTIYDRVGTYSSFATGFNAIAEEFKSSGRLAATNCSVDPTPECRWAKYKAAGLNVMYQALDPITNSTNNLGATSKLDEKFLDRAVYMYNELLEEYYNVDKKFPSQKLDVKPWLYEDLLETAFGWHLIMATGGQVPSSAKFTQTDDVKANATDEFYIYERIEFEDEAGEKYYLTAYSDTDAITADQIRIYLNEIDSEYGVQNLPTKVSTAINAYFAPIRARYVGSFNQLNLLYKLLSETNYNFASAANNLKAEKLVKINQDQFFSYEFDNDLFNDIYGDWWTKF